jgi:hypothetical protein
MENQTQNEMNRRPQPFVYGSAPKIVVDGNGESSANNTVMTGSAAAAADADNNNEVRKETPSTSPGAAEGRSSVEIHFRSQRRGVVYFVQN